jgi:hypothetical protein
MYYQKQYLAHLIALSELGNAKRYTAREEIIGC